MGCRFVGHIREEIVEVGTEFLVFIADFGDLDVDGVKLGGKGY